MKKQKGKLSKLCEYFEIFFHIVQENFLNMTKIKTQSKPKT